MATIRIVTARPHRLFAPLCREWEAHRQKGEPVLVLVPEQLTLQTEREIMNALRLDGMFDLDVVSPSRLYERVLEAGGRDRREPLSAVGRRMAVSLALERLEERLGYYGALTLRAGFVEKTAALITDLKRGGMTPDMLSAYAEELPQGITAEKLKDVSLIYAQYEKVLQRRFSDDEDQLAYVAGRLADSGYLAGKHCYVYGFDALPDQLTRFLCAAAPLCESLNVALVCDGESAGDGDLFLPVRQSAGRFCHMLSRQGMEARWAAFPGRELDAPPAVRHLDHNLFTLRPQALAAPQNDVFLFSGLSPYEEAALMTRQLLRLVSRGVDIQRVAVLCPEGNGYPFAVNAALRDSGIPFYSDQKLPAASHGLARYLLCAVRAMAEGYQNRDVLGMIKSGYAPLSYEEGCELENYAYAYGVNRARWTKPFSRGVAELCQRMESVRQRLIAPLLRARRGVVEAKDAASSMAAVFGLLQDANAYETLRKEEERLLDRELWARANQNSQIWQAILTLLDQMVRLSDRSRVPLKHLGARLECGLSALSLASLPPAGNMLHVGTLGHSLAENRDVVFLLGLNDGVLTRETQSLLTPEERANAQEKTGCFLGLTDESRALFARLDLKRAMTLPLQTLFLSYAKTSVEGATLRPLPLLDVLQKRVLPGLPQSPVPEETLPRSARQALNDLSVQLRAYRDGREGSALPPRQREDFAALARCPATAPAAMKLLRALRYDAAARPVSPETARALFGDETLTVSRLEQFAQCPFQHFLTYGLRPHVPREWKVDPIETGSFYHAALNGFVAIARKEPAYPAVPPERVREMTERAIAPLLDEVLAGPMGDGDRSLARLELAKSALHRATEVITRQLGAGEFRLEQTEASFGYENGLPPIVLTLASGREIMLRGRIDRIDRYDHEDGAYLRVIDYKSSDQRLDAARAWWGLQLQLLLYLDVCVAATPGGKPAGAFYFYVADPLVESDTDAAEAVEGLLRKTFCLKGISLCDVEVLQAMDRGEEPCVLPPVFQKSGQLRVDAKALSMEQMTALMAHARETAAQLAGELLGGKTDILPARDSSATACGFCDFAAVCHFQPDAPDAAFRELPPMNMAELREKLDG